MPNIQYHLAEMTLSRNLPSICQLLLKYLMTQKINKIVQSISEGEIRNLFLILKKERADFGTQKVLLIQPQLSVTLVTSHDTRAYILPSIPAMFPHGVDFKNWFAPYAQLLRSTLTFERHFCSVKVQHKRSAQGVKPVMKSTPVLDYPSALLHINVNIFLLFYFTINLK